MDLTIFDLLNASLVLILQQNSSQGQTPLPLACKRKVLPHPWPKEFHIMYMHSSWSVLRSSTMAFPNGHRPKRTKVSKDIFQGDFFVMFEVHPLNRVGGAACRLEHVRRVVFVP